MNSIRVGSVVCIKPNAEWISEELYGYIGIVFWMDDDTADIRLGERCGHFPQHTLLKDIELV